MLVCEECLREHKLSGGTFPSLGTCEMCGTGAVCLEVPKGTRPETLPQSIPRSDAWAKGIAKRAANADSAIDAIEALCRKYNSPATEPGTHALAAKILKIIEGKAP